MDENGTPGVPRDPPTVRGGEGSMNKPRQRRKPDPFHDRLHPLQLRYRRPPYVCPALLYPVAPGQPVPVRAPRVPIMVYGVARQSRRFALFWMLLAFIYALELRETGQSIPPLLTRPRSMLQSQKRRRATTPQRVLVLGVLPKSLVRFRRPPAAGDGGAGPPCDRPCQADRGRIRGGAHLVGVGHDLPRGGAPARSVEPLHDLTSLRALVALMRDIRPDMLSAYTRQSP